MYRNGVVVIICLCIVLPTLLFAAALERYKVPQQQSRYQIELKPAVTESVYTSFINKISNSTDAEKERMRDHFRKKLKEAVNERNFEAASYYRQLIEILNSKL